MSSIKTLLFDLGNVVFTWSFEHAFAYWSGTSGKDKEYLRNAFRIDHMYRKYETGDVSTEDYKTHLSKMLGIQFKENEFIHGWNAIFEEETAGVNELLMELKSGYRLISLSNTNEVHYPCMEEKYGHVFSHFERIFYSHEMHLRKPDREAFEYVFDTMEISPADVLFFDDLIENVRGARSFGLKAVQVKGIESLKQGLREHGIVFNDLREAERKR